MRSFSSLRPLPLPVRALPLLGWIALLSCARPPAPGPVRLFARAPAPVGGVQPRPLPSAPEALQAAGARRRDALFADRLRLIGARLPAQVRRGEALLVQTWWQVEEVPDAAEREGLQMFVHGQAPFAEWNQAQADHALLQGELRWEEVRAGDVLADEVSLRVPAAFPADRLELSVGLYQGNQRWSAAERDAPPRDDRVLLGVVPVTDGPPSLPVARARLRRAPIHIDGVLDEPDWQAAERIGPFVAHDGLRRLRHETFARLLWDEAHLFVAFEASDTDVHTPYTKRDDPLYESEVVEVFIDADGDGDEYVELQAAPNDVHFDAAFRGGRRKNFDTSYDVPFETRTRVEGTLQDASDQDVGFVSEWRIPVAALRDVPAPPRAGTEWRINLFRLDRTRRADRVVGTEASAWSSPLSGDFHNLARFGTLRFVDAAGQEP